MIFEFKFEAPVITLIFEGLAKLPFEKSASLIQGLQQEIAKQEQQAVAKARADEPVKRAADSVTAEVKERKKPGRKPEAANGAAEQPQAQ